MVRLSRVLVTGGAGFVGSHFVDGLLAEGLRVVRWEILRGWKPKLKGFDLEVELSHYVERKGYGIVEISMYYRARLGGKKLKVRHGFTILKRVLLESTC